jgi:hypothetical protein
MGSSWENLRTVLIDQRPVAKWVYPVAIVRPPAIDFRRSQNNEGPTRSKDARELIKRSGPRCGYKDQFSRAWGCRWVAGTEHAGIWGVAQLLVESMQFLRFAPGRRGSLAPRGAPGSRRQSAGFQVAASGSKAGPNQNEGKRDCRTSEISVQRSGHRGAPGAAQGSADRKCKRSGGCAKHEARYRGAGTQNRAPAAKVAD